MNMLAPLLAALLARKNYEYQGDDKLLADFMARQKHMLPPPVNEPNATALLVWSDGELEFWLRAQAHFVAGPRRRLLDVGCGTGRITAKLGWIFDHVTCVEADAYRIAQAKKYIARVGKPGLAERVTYVQARFEDFDGDIGSYDAVTCVHVIQHLSTDLPPRWLPKMHAYLRRGGVLALATTWSPRPRGSLSLAGMATDPTVAEHRFNRYARGEGARGVLAVRWFGEHGLRRMVQQSGFALIEQAPYSWLDSKDAMSQYVIAARGPCARARGTNELPADPRVGEIEPTAV